MRAMWAGGLFFLGAFLTLPGAHALCVSASKAVLRSGPGPQFGVSWTVGRYTPFLEKEKKGTWLRVIDQEGKEHWIAKAATTNKFQCLSVKSPKAPIYKGPGTNEPLHEYRQINKYMGAKKLGFDEGWHLVEDAFRQTYWINERHIWLPLTVTEISF